MRMRMSHRRHAERLFVIRLKGRIDGRAFARA